MEVDAEEEGRPDVEARGVGEGEVHALPLISGERETDPLPLFHLLALGLPVTLGVGAAPVLLPEALSPLEADRRGEKEGAGDAHAVAVAPFDGVGTLDGDSAGEDEALVVEVTECVGDREGKNEPEGRPPEALLRALAEEDGGAFV